MWKGLYHQISLMNHTMYTNDKWNILLLDLNYNSIFEALEGINTISTKKDQPWSKVFFLQTPLYHQKVHDQ